MDDTVKYYLKEFTEPSSLGNVDSFTWNTKMMLAHFR